MVKGYNPRISYNCYCSVDWSKNLQINVYCYQCREYLKPDEMRLINRRKLMCKMGHIQGTINHVCKR